mmetsp:Transcript_42792/g.123697  ORF Transcript_42792/g.123697 Transcript_42792/m.123697 type:complete len:307 (-) Transcript_42792:121-1041(-)
MGGNLSFTADADSIAEPGKKSVLCEGIDGADADKLFMAFNKFVRDGKTASGKESNFAVTDKDGGVQAIHQYDIPAAFGGGSWKMGYFYKFDAPARRLEVSSFHTEAQLDANTPGAKGTFVVHADPVRIEFWNELNEVRSAGPVLKGMMEHMLRKFSVTAEVKTDQPSIGAPDEKSVLSDPITDGDVTIADYFDKIKAVLVDEHGATELPDGTVIEDRSGIQELFSDAKSFAKHTYNTEERYTKVYEYGDDESLSVVRSITTMRLHADPFRVEMWNTTQPGRVATETELKFAKPFIEKVLKFMQEEM